MPDKDNRTEEATPKRLRDAKKKGQIAKSGDLNSAVSFFVFTMFLLSLGQYLIDKELPFLKNSLSTDFNMNISASNVGKMLFDGIGEYGIMLAPFALIAVILGIAVNLVQTGFIYTTETLKPDFKRINPISGFQNIVSKKALFTLVKNILKLIVVFYLSYNNVIDSLGKILNSGNVGSEKLLYLILELIRDFSLDISIIMLALALIDYIFQKREFKKDLRMTKQEIKDEYKEMEGNPQMKAARTQKHRQMAMSRMMESIEKATVVVTNPTHLAIALRYDEKNDKAPVVTAKGADYIAKKIKELAKDKNIPILENKPLAQSIYKKVEIGEYVPVELYKAIAEILAIVYQMKENNKYKI